MAFNDLDNLETEFDSSMESRIFGDEFDSNSPPSYLYSDLGELQKVPYYKRPFIQLAAVLGVGIPAIWLILSAFSGGEPIVVAKNEIQLDADKQNLINSLEEERKQNRELQLQNAMQKQEQMDVITIESQPKPLPKAAPQKISQPPAPKPAPRPAPKPQPQPIAIKSKPAPKPQPKPVAIKSQPDPMTQWLASANRGAYFTSASGHNKSTAQLVSRVNSAIESNTLKDRPLLNDAEIKQKLQNAPFSDRELNAKLSGTNQPRINPNRTIMAQTSEVTAKSQRFADIGSTAKAKLETSVVWTGRGNSDEKKYLIRLQEDFNNIIGETLLPIGTRLIAQVTDADSSGLVFMEVSQIIDGSDRIDVPAGVILIEGKNGSPLKANLKHKGDADFWANAGAIFAPAVEGAFDSLADNADSLVFEDGERTILRTTNRRSNPLASGAAGAAGGASQTLNRRLQRNINSETISSYFQLSSGETVYLTVYEDFKF